MALFDEDKPKEAPVAHRVGEDLSRLSIDELQQRIALLEAEVARLREAAEAKSASLAAAASFFRR